MTTPDVAAGQSGDDLLAQAARQLRDRPRRRAVEVANNVLDLALRSARVGTPVRAHAPLDYLRVADHLLIERIRAAIDTQVGGAATGRVVLDLRDDQHLNGVTVELVVQYGEILVELADAARAAVRDALIKTLGPQEAGLPVAVAHLHVSDVTRGDPHRE